MNKLNPRRLCGLYLILMCSVFLSAFSPAGYLNIAETKAFVFCVLTGAFLLSLLIVRLRQTRTKCKEAACNEMHGAALSGGYQPRRRWNGVHALLLAFWAWSLLSALCSPWPETAFLGGPRFDGMLTLTLYVVVLLLLSLYGDCARFPLWLPAAALMLLSTVAILQFFDLNPFWLFPGRLRWSGRETEYNGAFLSLTGNADLTASVLCTGFAFLWPLGFRAGKRWFFLPAAVCLGVLIASGIRAGMVGALAGVLLCLPFELPLGKKGRRIVAAFILLLCFAAIILVCLVPLPGTAGELHALLHGQAEDSFGSGRIYIWRNVWALIKERPLLGGGPDTLGERSLAFIKTLPDGAQLIRPIDCAHSQALNLVVNQGFPALCFLAAALIWTLIRAFRCVSPAAAALRTALVSYAAASLFDIAMPANATFFWILWGMLLAAVDSEGKPVNQRFNAV